MEYHNSLLLCGRPYGGVAILWRKSAFDMVSVIDCDNVRIAAIKLTVSTRTIVVFTVYMPTCCQENLPVFTECLSAIRSIMEIEENLGVESFFVLGDFNAHPNELFYKEMINFCVEQNWLCVDVNNLGIDSNTYTFISDVHGSVRWLDHCLVTVSASKTISNLYVKYDVYWSDHFPLVLECKLFNVKPKTVLPNCGHSNDQTRVIWGDRHISQIEKYSEICQSKLREIDFPAEMDHCCDGYCHNIEHKAIIDRVYNTVIRVLSNAASVTYRSKCPRKKGYIAGWNRYVADQHREARLKFQIWVEWGKPRSGNIYEEMLESRKCFKRQLKWCQNKQEQIKMDILASDLAGNNFGKFWKNTNKLNIKPSVPVSVGGEHNIKAIANGFKEHFTVISPLGSVSGSNNDILSRRSFKFVEKDIFKIITNMTKKRSPGYDGLSIEHFRYAGEHLPRILAKLFNFSLGHTYLPEALMRTIVVPIVKNKTGDTSDKSNYRPISLATTSAKVLDSLLNGHLMKYVKLHDAQFGFKSGVSTESAIFSLKHTVKYYTKRKTPVYACFLDLSKAFDLVNHELLWQKLEDTGMPAECTQLFNFWYKNQKNQVRWAGALSDEYTLTCGVRQGGLSSPTLFNLYINQLIERLSSVHVGCYIDGQCLNNLSYADDMVLLSPSIRGLRELISICESYAAVNGLVYNAKKSEILVFKAGHRSPSHVPPITLNGSLLNKVIKFKYLGHIITECLSDDEDIERERRALAVRSNMVARRFARGDAVVKITLFRAFCQSFYSGGLWVSYTRRAYNALRVQYNNAFRMLLNLPRFCSASGMFADARVPAAAHEEQSQQHSEDNYGPPRLFYSKTLDRNNNRPNKIIYK